MASHISILGKTIHEDGQGHTSAAGVLVDYNGMSIHIPLVEDDAHIRLIFGQAAFVTRPGGSLIDNTFQRLDATVIPAVQNIIRGKLTQPKAFATRKQILTL